MAQILIIKNISVHVLYKTYWYCINTTDYQIGLLLLLVSELVRTQIGYRPISHLLSVYQSQLVVVAKKAWLCTFRMERKWLPIIKQNRNYICAILSCFYLPKCLPKQNMKQCIAAKSFNPISIAFIFDDPLKMKKLILVP